MPIEKFYSDKGTHPEVCVLGRSNKFEKVVISIATTHTNVDNVASFCSRYEEAPKRHGGRSKWEQPRVVGDAATPG